MGAGWTAPEKDAPAAAPTAETNEDLDAIKQQLADLQEKLSKLS
jgi:polyhydroxyalkanoate synthesis regulator phasin